MRNKIGLNIASCVYSAVPLSSVPLFSGLWLTDQVARWAGYDFLQLLPLRSVSVKSLRRLSPERVLFYEEAWNPTTWWWHLRGKPGEGGLPTKLQDVVLFPSPQQCHARVRSLSWRFRGAVSIQHDVGKYGLSSMDLLEVHKGLNRPLAEILRLAKLSHGWLVLDTRHIRLMEGWVENWPGLIPQTRLVHVQAESPEEWARFVRGDSTTLGALLYLLAQKGYRYPLVVEFDPRSMGLRNMLLPFSVLRRIREQVIRCLEVGAGREDRST